MNLEDLIQRVILDTSRYTGPLQQMTQLLKSYMDVSTDANAELVNAAKGFTDESRAVDQLTGALTKLAKAQQAVMNTMPGSNRADVWKRVADKAAEKVENASAKAAFAAGRAIDPDFGTGGGTRASRASTRAAAALFGISETPGETDPLKVGRRIRDKDAAAALLEATEVHLDKKRAGGFGHILAMKQLDRASLFANRAGARDQSDIGVMAGSLWQEAKDKMSAMAAPFKAFFEHPWQSTGSAIKSVANSVMDFSQSMFSLNGLPAIILTITGINLALTALKAAFHFVTHSISEMVEKGMEMERTRTTFQVLTGDVERGAELFSRLQAMTLVSPYATSQLSDAAQTLLGMGVTASSIIPTLTRLGDIASGDAGRLRRLAFAYGEVLAEGRLSGQRIRQFATLGIGVGDFAQTMGISGAEFRAKMHENGVQASVVTETINRLTNEGGRFFEMQTRQLGTVEGQWHRLQNTIGLMSGKMGEAFLSSAGVRDILASISNLINEITPSMTAFAGYIGGYFKTAGNEARNLFSAMGGSGTAFWSSWGAELSRLIPDMQTGNMAIRGIGDVFLWIVDIIGTASAKIAEMVGKMIAAIVNWFGKLSRTGLGKQLGLSPFNGSDVLREMNPVLQVMHDAPAMWRDFMGGTINRYKLGGLMSMVFGQGNTDLGKPEWAANLFPGFGPSADVISFVAHLEKQRTTGRDPWEKYEHQRNLLMEAYWGGSGELSLMKGARGLGGILGIMSEIDRGGEKTGWLTQIGFHLGQFEGAIRGKGPNGNLRVGISNVIDRIINGASAALMGIGNIPLGPLGFLGAKGVGLEGARMFDDMTKHLDSSLNYRDHLTPAAMAGSAEAMDAINKGQLDFKTVAEEMDAKLAEANVQRTEANARLAEIAAWMEKNKLLVKMEGDN